MDLESPEKVCCIQQTVIFPHLKITNREAPFLNVLLILTKKKDDNNQKKE
jgi:hypothetical protein